MFNIISSALLKRLAKLTAQTALYDFKMLQLDNPELSKEELYYRTILENPKRYTPENAKFLIDTLKETVDRQENVHFSLQELVIGLFLTENVHMFDSPLDPNIAKAEKIIKKIIPPTL